MAAAQTHREDAFLGWPLAEHGLRCPTLPLPQFPHTAVSPAGKQPFRQSYVTGVGCKEKGGLEGGITD